MGLAAKSLTLKCKNCTHKKADHYSPKRNPNWENSISSTGSCNANNCDCDEFSPVYSEEYAKGLYEEYMELGSITKVKSGAHQGGDKVTMNNVDSKDLMKLDKIKNELKKCLHLLSKDELIKLTDSEFNDDVHRILASR